MESSNQQNMENLSALLKNISGYTLSVPPETAVIDIASLLKKNQDVSAIMIFKGIQFLGIVVRE
jgi:hypothetical protein